MVVEKSEKELKKCVSVVLRVMYGDKAENVSRKQNLIRHNPNLVCLHKFVKSNFSGFHRALENDWKIETLDIVSHTSPA